ncbi:DMT family transporter [Pseudooceanicola sp. CBS1P-1]|uniref:EamA family transporter n=1 Tax=Pseudooceanicola albus TaxID=2692189 RepID=A0A6L7G8U5_9RHOB|nr:MULTISPECIES: DMT family transporter [Pseudooceanicola]MBT9384074.1 DMT family transporter [Pseudooceanicola endophyticus]MXN19826.1 EamA family transporter [Pseudooceanicola albus]
MTEQNTRKGIMLMILTTLIFAVQDAFSLHLSETYNVLMVVMMRYWFFAAFVIAMGIKQAGSLRAAASTAQPGIQIFRSALLALEICVMVLGFTYLGIIETQAVFICYPLLIAALSGPVLGEKVGWRRWSAIGVGFIGVLIILEPGFGVFKPAAVIPLIAALMFAGYGLLNRYVARKDSSATSFFWTGVTGFVLMTAIGLSSWETMSGTDWILMLILCIAGASGHYLLIRVYEIAEASAVQPFAYFQLAFGTMIAIPVFGEHIRTNVAIGAALIIGAGLFTFFRERQKA